MEPRQKKMEVLSKLTQKKIDELFRQLSHLEKLILNKEKQIDVLEKYKGEYTENKLKPGLNSPFLLKNVFDFLDMIQNSINQLLQEIKDLKQQKELLFNSMKQLNVKKDLIEQYIVKIQQQEQIQLAKIEQKKLDELAILLHSQSLSED